MVAVFGKFADPFPPPTEWIAARRASQVLLTRHDVAAMISAGVVPEDASTELLHGALLHVDRSASGENPLATGIGHLKCVEKLSNLRHRINSAQSHVQSQQPLICSETHEPLPDFTILKGTLDSYITVPTASDALCVIEVADSSYERDFGEKLFGYVRAGIPQYIIINLRNLTAEIYTEPDAVTGTYGPPVIVGADQELRLHIGDDRHFSVAMAEILP
jgi:hypothetical protein